LKTEDSFSHNHIDEPIDADDTIAVVGIGLRLPGRVHDLESLWSFLERGAASVGPIPRDRWVAEDYFDADRSQAGRAYVQEGSFLEHIDQFNAEFFNISPREARSIDPQHRLTLEVAWEALEHAGMVPATLAGTRTGVFIGIGTSDYDFLREDLGEARTYLGTQPSFAAGRLAFTLGLRGPSLIVDTGCSSSLVSLHLACRALRNRECDTALSGAVQIMAAPDHYIQLAKIGALAPDGRSKTFSANADGFGRGEGVVVLVLQRLAEARLERRDILALIRGTAVNHNGTDPSGITAPNEVAQRDLLLAALDDAGLRPAAIDYIECHGTGTPIGDPIEVRAISSVHADRPLDQPVRIGSVKTNLGHLEVAAGLAGVAKVLASLRHESLPPTINTLPRNPAINWADSRVEVVDEVVPWPRTKGHKRRAGVSAFGLSGTNAHAILEEAPQPEMRPRASKPAPVKLPLLVSGRTPSDLEAQLARLAAHLRGLISVDVLDLSYALATTRTHFAKRRVVLVETDWTGEQLACAVERAANPGHVLSIKSSDLGELAGAAERHVGGHEVDWQTLFRPYGARRVSLPTYAFAPERHWIGHASTEVTLLLHTSRESQLRSRAEQVHAYLVGHPRVSLVDLGHALSKKTDHSGDFHHTLRAEHRAAIVTRSRETAKAALAALAAGEPHAQALSSAGLTNEVAGKLVFAFPGQGAQWPEMARELLERSPTFATSIAACERAFATHVDWSLSGVLREPTAVMFERVDVIQPVLFAMMVALARVWRELGVSPDAVFGQSQGEIAAAHVAGALSLDDAAKVVCLRSRAIRALEGKGGMAAVVLPRERLAGYLSPFGERLAVAGDNGPSTVVCGEPEAIDELIAGLAVDGVFARRINVNYASHTAQVEQIRDELLAALADIEPRTAEIPMYSTVEARWVVGEELDAHYWYRNLRQMIRLADAVEGLLDEGHRWFVEVSPHPVMSVSLEVLFDQLGRTALAVPTLRREHGGLEQLQLSLAQLWVRGYAHDWTGQFEALGPRPLAVELPTTAPEVSPVSSAKDPFWTAIDNRDIDALGDSLTLDAGQRELLSKLFPAFVAARTKQLEAELIPDLRYRIEWTELARSGARSETRTARSGVWLVVTSSAIEVELPTELEIGMELLVLADDATPAELDAALVRVGDVAGVVSLLALDERPHPEHPSLPLGLTLNLALGQALGRCSGAARLWTATRGAVSVGADDALRCPNQAMCWGLGRSLSLAHPARWGGLIDLEAAAAGSGRVAIVSRAELLHVIDMSERTDGEDELAQRGGKTFARRLVRAPQQLRVAVDLPAIAGAVLITGGTGALGGHFARWFARAGVDHLILASRSGLEASGAGELQAELAALGVRVSIETCDVAERESVARLFERLREQGVELRGVVHAAGVPGPILSLSELTVAQLAAVTSGKAGGARWLHELAAEHGFELDLFVVLSSFWAVWGNPQVSSYAIANSYLDALAEHRIGLGQRATTTAWGVWDGLGLGEVEQRLDRIGFRRITPAVALAAFAQILAQGERKSVVADIDWARFVRFYAQHGARRLLEMIPEARNAGQSVESSAGDELAEPRRIAMARAAPAGQRAQLLLDLVVEQTAGVLGLPVSRLDPDVGFSDLGLDSIMSVELRGELERATGLTLPATFVFEHPCAREASAYLGERLALVGEPAAVAPMVAPRVSNADPIAIVGVGLRMPGDVSDLDALFRLLELEIDTVGPVPPERWDADAFYDPDPDAAGKTYVREAAFVHGVERFDPAFFNISPREAERIDPQHRLLLEASWEALERADVIPASLRASQTGVFVGIGQSDYEFMQQSSGLLDPYTTLGTHGSFAAGRIAFCLGLQGPAMSIDTACSSSLVALHLASGSLRSGECSLALAAGVQVMAAPDYGIQLARTRSLAPDGRSKAFSAAADGFGRGEGVVVLVLERLSDARRNGRRVLALVRGSAVNHDGASSGITAPNGAAQQQVIRTALADAGLGPLDVDVVECHGTGTSLGDPIEVRALDAVYGEGRSAERRLKVGAIKTNVGHLESAAGLAGVAKLLAAFAREAIPATIHTRPRNPHLDWDALGIEVVDALRPWPRCEGAPRRAGVSSFGLSGTNAHAILEEAPVEAGMVDARAGEAPVIAPVLLSGRSEQAVREQARRLRAWVLEHPGVRLGDLAYSLATARTHFERRVVVVGDLDDALARLGAGGAEENAEIHEVVRAPRLALMFAGQGSQCLGMGAALHAALPSFRAAFDAACRHFDAVLEVPLRDVVFAQPGTAAAALLDRTMYTQPALFALELGLARALESVGVRPQIVLGHSIGELVAAHVAGVFDLEDACRLVAARARLMDALEVGGAMISIQASEQEVLDVLEGGQVDIAGINGPMSTVISGDEQATLAVAAGFAARGRRTKRLSVSHAFHSHRMNPMLDAFAAVARTVSYRAPEITVVSCVTGLEAEPETLACAEYWVEQVRRCVRFADGAASLVELGATVMLELGPQAVLASMAQACIESGSQREREPLVLASLRGDRPELESFTEMLGQLHCHGIAIEWETVFAGHDVRRVELPTYAFVRDRYWLAAATARVNGRPLRVDGDAHPLLGSAFRMSVPADAVFFERSLSISEFAWLGDHRIEAACVFPGAGFVELALAAAREVSSLAGSVCVEQLRLDRALILRAEEPATIQVALREDGTSGGRVSVSESSGGAWKSLSSARVPRALPNASPVDGLSLDELRRRCRDPRSVDEFYASTRRSGYAYGPAFRGVEQLWLADDGAMVLARVVLPTAAGSDARFVVHPALLDACFQLTLATRLGRADSGPMVPVQIDRVAFVREPGKGPLWCSASTRAHETAGRTITELRLFDESGVVIGWIDGFVAEQLERGSVIENDDEALADALLEPVWRELTERPGAAVQPGGWVIFAGAGSRRIAERVRAGLDALGAQARVIDDVEPDDRAAVDAALDGALREPLAGVVSLWALDEPALTASLATAGSEIGRRGWAGALHLTQSLVGRRLRRAPRLVLVTHRAQSPNGLAAIRPEQTPCWGLGASIRSEHAELQPLCVDLGDPDDALELAALAELALSDTHEDRVAVRGRTVHVNRLVRARLPRPIAANDGPDGHAGHAGHVARRLVIDRPGSLDDLRIDVVARREPGPGQVEIAVEAAGINFRDVLLATGVVPPIGDERIRLGFECAGTITALGPLTGDSLRVGDRVVAMTADGFATHVLAQAQLVLPLPGGLSFSEAATLPQVQVSAYYALHHVARLRRGERVLIHSATGGVGLAAFQWAKHVGAEIFATAGNERKRAWLREQGIEHVSDSRSNSFVADVLAWTRGEGVDVVLNSLSGELMRQSLGLVRPGGRFVELGLRDAIAQTQLELAPFARGLSYTLVNLGELILHAPARVRELFVEVLEHVESGVLAPLPLRSAPLSSAPELLWEMGRGRHIGKFVVTVGDAERTAATHHGRASVSADASYLITGGLGGLGLSLARSLAQQGAGELILVGRHGVSREDQRAAIADLQAAGARVRVAAIDVADREALAELVATLAPERPLRGIVHAAAVLEDAMLVNATLDSFTRVMAPKVVGAWNLHCVSERLELDFFVLYGSVASILGAPGQANYVAANEFLAGLARHRRALGLPGLCLSWGPFAEVGLAAADARRGARLGGRGLQEFTVDEGLELFARLRACERAQLVPCRFDPATWAEFYPEAAGWPYLAELTSTVSSAVGASEFLDELAGRPPVVARRLLVELVVRELARVTRADAATIDPATPFAELGVDSLMGIELRNRLRLVTRVELSATAIWTHPSPAALAVELLELIRRKLEPAIQQVALEVVPAPEMDAEERAILELDTDTATNELLAELEGLDLFPEVRSHV
jgi:polyketide synthase 12